MEHFELIQTDITARVYVCEKELAFDINGEKISFFDWPTKDISRIEKPTKYFGVSDAHTHIERLVFPLCPGSKEGKWRKGDYCHGKMTFLIHGGDESTIRPDEEYLTELWNKNQALTEVAVKSDESGNL